MGKKSSPKPIIVTGFPYAFPYYRAVFDYFIAKNELILILPDFWSAKDGKIQIPLVAHPNIHTEGLKTVSYGGKSAIKGLFKGWMPGIAVSLITDKVKYKSHILYSCSEPHLLTTLWNGFWAKILGYKHILFTWQNIPPEKRLKGLKLNLSNSLVRLNLRFADGVICGNVKAQEIIKKFSPRVRTMVSPIAGVDTEKFKPGIHSNLREKFNLDEKKLILFFGVLDKRKAVDVLLNAFSRISNREDLKLVIVGTGPEEQKLRDQAVKLGIPDKVLFIDWMKNDDLPALLSIADVFAYPSRPEGGWEEQFGYAMAEASSCEVPVVATRTGSMDEVVKDGETGFLVEPNDSKQLAESIERLLLDDNLRRKLGHQGREYTVSHFGHATVARRIESFLSVFKK